MKLVESEREQVRSVAERWRKAYFDNGRWYAHRTDKTPRDALHQRLLALDVETATADDVAAIIGNGSWVAPAKCNDCGARSYRCVELGEPPDYESATAHVCVDCLRKALALAEGAR